MIYKEQNIAEEDVAEYLRLCAAADKQQAARIKSVFDKKKLNSFQQIEKVVCFLKELRFSVFKQSFNWPLNFPRLHFKRITT